MFINKLKFSLLPAATLTQNTQIYVQYNVLLPKYMVATVVIEVGRSRVRFPMVSLEFFIDIILPAALWLRG